MDYESVSPEQTRAAARRLAQRAQPGMVVCLAGDLGAGKTEFAKGFAEGLGIDALITSPTFTIVNEYVSGRLPLYHFDVYRVADEDQMQDTGYEEYFYGDGVSLIEWADLIPWLIPETAVWVHMEKDLSIGDEYRRILIKGFE